MFLCDMPSIQSSVCTGLQFYLITSTREVMFSTLIIDLLDILAELYKNYWMDFKET